MEITIPLILNGILVALGFLITFELHDIKARIVRLENLFIHPIIRKDP